ncbi:MAG: magnesium and cobalt exporter, family [Blastocatellia bacterium]|jgi:CBS domain containing-hemolysin-like protein|nr:magnesium and cobalt exporter, family [Blastocatellia bacterium]
MAMDEPGSYLLALFFDETTLHAPLTLGGIVLRLGAVFLLVGANGFFVGSEFALVSVRRTRLAARATTGSKSALAALRLVDDPTIFISAVQLGITLASLALGLLGEPTIEAMLLPVAERFTSQGTTAFVIAHGVAIAVAFTLITYMHIVLGELMPKMIALERAETLALWSARPLELFARIFRAPLWVFNKTGASLGRLLGLKSSLEHTSVYTEAEIRQLIDVARESGHLRPAEQRLIHRVFEFSDTLVREAMVPRTEMAAIPSDATLEQIAKAFRQHAYSRLPVYRESLDDVLGFIHSKDLMPFLLHPEKFRLELVLQAPPLYVVVTARLEDVLKQMQKERVHFGFVVDEHGGVEGIITLEDLLEEIVGDISDEHDPEVDEQILKLRDGTYLLDGGLVVRDLNRRLKLSLPESEAYTTIAGFLMDAAGHILERGEVISYDGLRFHVERVERRRVLSVRMEKTEERADADAKAEAVKASVNAPANKQEAKN